LKAEDVFWTKKGKTNSMACLSDWEIKLEAKWTTTTKKETVINKQDNILTFSSILRKKFCEKFSNLNRIHLAEYIF
jgi:hypothetical protein